MTLNQLQFLVILAQEQHFGRAAARCGVSQPALSLAIRHLEEDLGVLLCERGKSGIRITAMGERILVQAKQMMAQTALIKSLADTSKNPLGGRLNMGIISTLAPYLLPSLLPQLQLMANQLCVTIDENHSDDLQQKLRSGDLDVILLAQPLLHFELVSQTLFTEPLLLLINNQHPLAAKPSIEPRDCQGQTLLVLNQPHCLREQVLAIFATLSDGEKPVFSSSGSLETIRHRVAAGLGMSVLPLSATNRVLDTNPLLVTRAFVAPQPTRTLTLVWRSSFPRHKTLDVLRSALQLCSWQFTTEHNSLGPGLLVDNSW